MPINEPSDIELEEIRKRRLAAIEVAAGCWGEEDHPELKDGINEWVRSLREESEVRFRRIFSEHEL